MSHGERSEPKSSLPPISTLRDSSESQHASSISAAQQLGEDPNSERIFPPESREPSLLQRMHDPISSNNLKKRLNLSEEVESQKRPRSPLFYESLETNPMSHSPNPKRRKHSTPILPKSSLFNQFSMNPGLQENQTHHMSIHPRTPLKTFQTKSQASPRV